MTEHSSRTHALLRWLAFGLAAIALATAVVYQQTRLGREVKQMPEAERRALYDRTLKTLKDSCASATGPTLKEYCRQQAEFLMAFPECDDACGGLVLQLAQSPTR